MKPEAHDGNGHDPGHDHGHDHGHGSGDRPVGDGGPAVQLRFAYRAPAEGQRWRLTLTGLTVNVLPEDGDVHRAAGYLDASGVRYAVDELGFVYFGVAFLPLLATLPDRVVVVASPAVALLRQLITGPASVVVSAGTDADTVNVGWFDGTVECNEPFPVRSVAALVACGAVLTADERTWELIRRNGHAAAPSRGRVNLDGFIEVRTATPQLFDRIDVAGVFRIDDGRFGAALAAADALDAAGVPVEGTRPAVGPVDQGVLAATGTDGRLARRVARDGAVAVVWPDGHRRRFHALAAAAAVADGPVRVLSTPAQLWLWRHHIAGLGGRFDVDVHSYRRWDVEHDRFDAVDAVVFDDLAEALADGAPADVLASAGATGAGRVATMTELPGDERLAALMMAVLRPHEFRGDVPVALRYGAPAAERFWRHVELYVDRHTGRRTDDDGEPRPAPTGDRLAAPTGDRLAAPAALWLRTERVAPSAAQRVACDELAARGGRLDTDGDPTGPLRRLSSIGTGRALSPKVATVVGLVRRHRDAVVVTAHREFGGLLAAAAPHVRVVVDADSAADVFADHALVVVADLPRRWRGDVAALAAAAPDRSCEVVVVHVDGLDDDWADHVDADAHDTPL